MSSLATVKSAYLAPPPNAVLPAGTRQQLAGALYQIDQQVAGGATVPVALSTVSNKRFYRIIHKAQAESTPFQASLVADVLAISTA